MKLTRASEYAIRCVLYLATRAGAEIISRREVAEAMDIPNHFLGKIVQSLSRAGILEITQGARGGYRLLERPCDISLLAVIEAMEGGIYLNQCLLREKSCERSHFCAVHQVWEEARQALRGVLAKADFATLARKECQTVISGV